MTERKQLGKKAGAWAKVREAQANDVWIKNFRAPETRIRILDHIEDWVHYFEHFNPDAKSFACTEDKTCLGCNHPDPETSKRSNRWAFNALDDKGNLNIYKVGPSVYDPFESRQARLGTLSDRDYIIVKTGSGMQTKYQIDPGEKYPVDKQEKLIDISQIITDYYYEKVIPTLSEQVEEMSPEEFDSGESPLDAMTNSQLLEFIAKNNGEAPSRASRAVLLEIAKDLPPF